MTRKDILVIGVTGQTGAGKSLVCEMLEERGFTVIDADMVSRQVVSSGTRCLLDLSAEFGVGIIEADGTLNRKRLGEIVFNDKKRLKTLNNIIFPYITVEINERIAELARLGESPVFLNAPTLFESGADKTCDKIVSVTAEKSLRRARIIARDFLTENEADSRINSQRGDDYYISRSDFIIENSGELTDLRVRVMEMLGAFDIALKQELPP